MSALFNFGTQPTARTVNTVLPDQPFSLPYEFRNEMNWLDFSGTANPLGTPKSFTRAIHAALVDGEVVHSPDRNAYSLRSSLAKRFGLVPESFLCGASVSHMIQAVGQTYQRCRVGVFSPSPAEYNLAIENAGHEVVALRSAHGFVIPDVTAAKSSDVQFDAAVLANPSYPASRLLQESTLIKYLESMSWVVVDESLLELSLGGESAVSLTERHENLIVVRSLSSMFAIPGIPISYCIAHPRTIAQIEKFFDNSNICMFAEVLGDVVLDELDHMERTREFLDTEIPWMQCMLSLIPGIRIFPAEANFVMCSFVNNGSNFGVSDATELILRLQLAGFFVRKLEGMPGIRDDQYFCVSIRQREDNEKLLAALRGIIMNQQ